MVSRADGKIHRYHETKNKPQKETINPQKPEKSRCEIQGIDFIKN